MARTSVQDALDAAVCSVRRLPERDGGSLTLPRLALSLVGIAVAALAFASLAAVVAVLVIRLDLGRDGYADFLADLRFSPILQARRGAAEISVAYVGVIVATIAAAALAGRRGTWTRLLAAGPARWRTRGIAPVAAATLGYGILFTLAQVAGRERHLTVSGPTDMLLLATLVGNLVVLAPLAEELFFRGWLYTGLRARWRYLPVLLVTTAAFAAIHWYADQRHALRVLPLALALGILRERSGSIRPALALHALYNGTIVAITLAAA